MDDHIDFICSPTWLNFYHEKGLTPRYYSEPMRQTYQELQDQIRRLRTERQKVRLTDEQWFSRQELKRIETGIHQQYQQDLKRQQAKIHELERAQVPESTSFQGIPVKPSIWEQEQAEDMGTHE